MPRLAYTPPVELYHGALRPPEVYDSTRTNASIQVYDFRPVPSDVVDHFHRTMLREWVAPQYQETQLAGPPAFGPSSMPGAQAVYGAQFAEVITFGGWPRPRLRVLVLAGAVAAMVDAQAQSPQAWAMAYPSFDAMLSTMRVEADGPAKRADARTAATQDFAGLYAGIKPKFISAIGPGFGAGSGSFVPARHMYLFSGDGQVYRAYDDIPAGGDPDRFDFDYAARADPVNSGRYDITSGRLTLTMGERLDEVIVAPLARPGRVTIETVTYVRE
jgi:hypothetical protein